MDQPRYADNCNVSRQCCSWGRDDRIVRTPRITLQKSKRSGNRAIPVAIKIRATVPAANGETRKYVAPYRTPRARASG